MSKYNFIGTFIRTFFLFNSILHWIILIPGREINVKKIIKFSNTHELA
jgi:hypothetical protein